MSNVTYDRPVTAKLVVQLDNGETFDARSEDVAKFGYVEARGAYMAFRRHVAKVLEDANLIGRAGDLTNTAINPIRHLVEMAINYPELLDHPETAETNAQLVTIERALRAHLPKES